ncbi:MAG: 30S ribosomal protein S19 [Thermoplasmata archaeon]|jgi:small subunit ribosomal protein S19
MPEEKETVKRKQSSKKRRAQKLSLERTKEFKYKGYTLEELKTMKLEDLIKILNARARRSLTREMNSEQLKLFKKLMDPEIQLVKTHVRDLIILPYFVGKRVQLYNGKEFQEFEIKPEMIGHYLGEFVLTRKEVKHSAPGVGATRSSKYVPLK